MYVRENITFYNADLTLSFQKYTLTVDEIYLPNMCLPHVKKKILCVSSVVAQITMTRYFRQYDLFYQSHLMAIFI